jgi:ornithine cyclodeaminase/alanine dehydrogenase-like protein (mu-crystallin family)
VSAGVKLPPVIDADTLRASIRFTDLIEPVATAFTESSSGLAENGLIVTFPAQTREAVDVYVKTGVLRGHPIFVAKVSPSFAVNVAKKQPQGGLLVAFDVNTGHTLAILDEQHFLSDIRTAAAGAVAARALCPPGVRRATVLGSGVQAYWQALALHHERPYEQLTIWARDVSKARALADRLSAPLASVTITVGGDVESSIRAADVVITATPSRNPIVSGEWLHEGRHVTTLGADDPTKCELSAAALKRARVFVDHVETAARNGRRAPRDRVGRVFDFHALRRDWPSPCRADPAPQRAGTDYRGQTCRHRCPRSGCRGNSP